MEGKEGRREGSKKGNKAGLTATPVACRRAGAVQRDTSEATISLTIPVLHDSTTRLVGPSVGRLVCPSVCPFIRRSITLYFFGVFAVFGLTAPAHIWSDLNYGPCPPACDWVSRVSGLIHLRSTFFDHKAVSRTRDIHSE